MTERRDDRSIDTTDEQPDPDEEALEGDRPSGWAGIDDALGGTGNRQPGAADATSSLDDETPGSQGDVEAGSEGDFGRRDERRS